MIKTNICVRCPICGVLLVDTYRTQTSPKPEDIADYERSTIEYHKKLHDESDRYRNLRLKLRSIAEELKEE